MVPKIIAGAIAIDLGNFAMKIQVVRICIDAVRKIQASKSMNCESVEKLSPRASTIKSFASPIPTSNKKTTITAIAVAKARTDQDCTPNMTRSIPAQ